MTTPNEQLQPTPSQEKIRLAIQKHPLLFFFLLAFAFSWIVSIPFILSEWGIFHGNFTIVFAIKSFGPFLAAFIVTKILEGKEGVARLLERNKQWKVNWKWYLLILLGIPAAIMSGIIVQPGSLDGFKGLNPLLMASYPLTFVAVFFGGGPLGEEPGWRGFALPRLQKRFGPLWGTLLLGVLWTCWHLPDFLTSAQGGGPGTGFKTFLTNFPIFFLLVLALTIILTWIFNCSGNNVFLALLAHTSINTPQVVLVPLFPSVGVTMLNLSIIISFGIPALLAVILTRGRLGYSSSKE